MAASEVIAEVEIEISEQSIGRKLAFGIAIGVENHARTGIPARVVPDDTEAPYPVEIKIAEREVAQQ